MRYKNKKELEIAISLLKLKQTQEFELLKQQLQVSYESMKPLSILKSTLHEIVSDETTKTNIIDTALALGANYLLEKITPKKPANKLTKILASFLKFAIIKASAKIQ